MPRWTKTVLLWVIILLLLLVVISRYLPPERPLTSSRRNRWGVSDMIEPLDSTEVSAETGMAVVAQLLKHKPDTIYSVAPGAPVLEAIRLMAEHGVGALLVMEGELLVGVVSERDYARKVILKGRSSNETAVRQIMSSPVWTVRPDQSVRECMQIVNDKRVRHLPVVEGERVVGVLSIGDLVHAVLEEQQKTIEELEQYIRS